MKKHLVIFVVFISSSLFASAQQTIGLISHTSNSLDSGYVLFAPMAYTHVYLIDKCGKLIHKWATPYRPGLSVYLDPDSSLMATGVDYSSVPFQSGGGRGGWLYKESWGNQLLWSYKYSDSVQCQHHDIEVLPNGNVLAIAWELKSRQEALAAGRDTAFLDTALWSGKIVELKPVGTDSADVVWEWHSWDHLIQDYDSTKANYGSVAAHPELINLNYVNTNNLSDDWLHINSIAYNAQFDQIMISIHNFNEIWIIDHSTTTAQAASHTGGNSGKGGDLLYRWGNPQAYDRGTASDQKFYGQHDATWIPSGYRYGGDIMVFNNGVQRPGWPTTQYSSIDIFKPAVDSAGHYTTTLPYLPSSEEWTYTDSVPTDFYSGKMGSVQMLSNGNLLISISDKGTFFEIDSMKNKVWKYINPVSVNGPQPQGSTSINANGTFRCTFYPYSYPAFTGKNLPEGAPLETNPNNYACNLNVNGNPAGISSLYQPSARLSIYPDPASNAIQIVNLPIGTPVKIYNSLGGMVEQTNYSGQINIKDFSTGIYFLVVENKHQLYRHKFLIVR